VNKFLFGLTLAILLPAMHAPAWAGFQEGAAAYNKGDYAAAMTEWLPLAQAGDAQAENAVGALYDNGLGVTADEAEAFRWYSMAADQNFPLAMRNIGTMYATGHGVPYSLPQAQMWLGRAAGAGDQVAAKRLAALPPVAAAVADPVKTPLFNSSNSVGTGTVAGGANTNGFGTTTGPSSLLVAPAPANTVAASADQPAAPSAVPVQPVASNALAPATGDQQATPASSAPSFPAAKPAASTDAAVSATDQAATAPTTSATTAAPTPTQVASSQPVASTATATTASSDQPAGTVADGWHAFDLGDYQTALNIWRPLAEQGDSNLQILVGSLYDYGQGVKQDKAAALQWYLKAADKGSGRGQLAAGAILAKDAKQRNLVEAYKWLTVAAQTLSGQAGDVSANQALSLRQQIARHMSKDDIAKAEALAQGFHAS
jgi:hypothetical protein